MDISTSKKEEKKGGGGGGENSEVLSFTNTFRRLAVPILELVEGHPLLTLA